MTAPTAENDAALAGRAKQIPSAFFKAQARRPYKSDNHLVSAATPPGGSWTVDRGENGYNIFWGEVLFASINLRIGAYTAGQIAMAMRATPVMDCALRSIIVLAENADNIPLIRDLAVAVIAHVEEQAPDPYWDDEDEPEEGKEFHTPDSPVQLIAASDDEVAF